MFCRGLARRVKIAKNVSFEVSRMQYVLSAKMAKIMVLFFGAKIQKISKYTKLALLAMLTDETF